MCSPSGLCHVIVAERTVVILILSLFNHAVENEGVRNRGRQGIRGQRDYQRRIHGTFWNKYV